MRSTTSRGLVALFLVVSLALAGSASAAGLPEPSTAKAGTVQGWAVSSDGAPLANAMIAIFGTTMAGQNTRFEVKTGKDGRFRQRVPEGIYGVRAEYTVSAGNKAYTVALDPVDGVTSKTHDSEDGIAKDFVWRISGLRPGATAGDPGTHNEPGKYYGGSMQVSVQQDGFATGEPFPAGSTIVAKLTPEGALFDGSAGRPVELRRTFTNQVRSTSYWYPCDIPLGRYSVRLSLEQPGQPPRPLTLKKSLEFSAPYTDTVSVDFLPSSSSGASLPVQVSVKP